MVGIRVANASYSVPQKGFVTPDIPKITLSGFVEQQLPTQIAQNTIAHYLHTTYPACRDTT